MLVHNVQLTSATVAEGRQCATIPSAEGLVSCCLPCPATAWVYADGKIALLSPCTGEVLIAYDRLQSPDRCHQLAQRGECRVLCAPSVVIHSPPRTKDSPTLSHHLPRGRFVHYVGMFSHRPPVRNQWLTSIACLYHPSWESAQTVP